MNSISSLTAGGCRMPVYVYIYIYLRIYKERKRWSEGEREREGEREQDGERQNHSSSGVKKTVPLSPVDAHVCQST